MTPFDVLAEPNRRRILDLLRDSEQPVGELVSQLQLTQPAVSKHLRVLREAGLVHVRGDAQRRLYSVRPDGLADLHSFLADVLPAGLERLKHAAEEEERSDARRASRN